MYGMSAGDITTLHTYDALAEPLTTHWTGPTGTFGAASNIFEKKDSAAVAVRIVTYIFLGAIAASNIVNWFNASNPEKLRSGLTTGFLLTILGTVILAGSVVNLLIRMRTDRNYGMVRGQFGCEFALVLQYMDITAGQARTMGAGELEQRADEMMRFYGKQLRTAEAVQRSKPESDTATARVKNEKRSIC